MTETQHPTPAELQAARDYGATTLGRAVKRDCLTSSTRSARGRMILLTMNVLGIAHEPRESDVDAIADAFWGES